MLEKIYITTMEKWHGFKILQGEKNMGGVGGMKRKII